jgi:hypothetical protein
MTVAMRYCQNVMPVEAMPMPPYSAGVDSIDCSTLVPAKARLAVSIKRAPVVGCEVEEEEIWFMSILSVTSFLRVYGRTRDVVPGGDTPLNRSLSSGL